MDKNLIIEDLKLYVPSDTNEDVYLKKMISFLTENDNVFDRTNTIGQITVSAILTDLRVENILLLWHKKLKRWLQPGGHVESTIDSSLLEAAFRELIEETELEKSSIVAVSGIFFDIDIHVIPANQSEPEHNHYDLRYHFKLESDTRPVGNFKWIPIGELIKNEEESLSRFARKLYKR
jgi:8-oxo-dGTP pyrophosphatase MutT (NUDIX family)